MELLTSLNKKLSETFAKSIAELNKNVYISAKLDSGNYDAPTVTLGSGGGTVVKEKDQKLEPPAMLRVELKETPPVDIVYRIAISRSEAEIADKNPAYFLHLFNKIMEKALGNYKATVGGPEVLRFGSHYIKISLRAIEDGSDYVELRLDGSWADV